MTALIRAQALTKQFDRLTAVSELSLEVGEGEILALLGPNGAGKTTTVRMLTSILKPTSGSASVAGFDVGQAGRQVRQSVGTLTEFPGLYSRMTARDYLDFFGELHGMSPAARRARAAELMESFGIADAADRRLGGFSKGMRQKVSLIRAMLHSPRALFLDEPTSAMDPYSSKQVRDAIEKLRGSGHTILLCTHNLHEAETLADRIAMIRRGRLIAFGTVDELKRQFLGAPLMEVRLAQPLASGWPDLNGHLQIEESGGDFIRYRTAQPQVANPLLLKRLHEVGAAVLTVSELPQSLEQVYLKLMED